MKEMAFPVIIGAVLLSIYAIGEYLGPWWFSGLVLTGIGLQSLSEILLQGRKRSSKADK